MAFSGHDIILSASTDFFSGESRIYRRPMQPDGAPVAISGGHPGWLGGFADTGCIATHGAAIALADRGGNLYVSDDFGATWSRPVTGLSVPSGVLIR